MTITLLIQLSDGTYTRKSKAELRDGDMVVFDGPEMHAELDAMEAEFDAEVAAAGGIEKWKARDPARVA
jgi:hypothetical protein